MNGIKRTERSRLLASTAMLSGAMFTIMLLPAYGQQDVSPDWYDPTPNTAVVHAAQPVAAQSSRSSAATHQHQQTAKSLPLAASAGKRRAKNASLDQGSQSNVPAADDRTYESVASVERSDRLGPIGQR